ncbi:MAG: hypothetical protein WCP35_13545 [Verrucomicrobiota bacterium]
MDTFTSVDDSVLIQTIGSARQRLVFIAPGLRPPVADALAAAMQVIPTDSIHIVLDVDAEVCRLGYGDKDFKGMGILQAAALCRGLTVNNHPGIRIGLLIADDLTLVYSPTPELIETESRQPDKPNAICLRSAVPPQLASACAIGAEGFLNLEVGHEPVEQKKIEAVKRELAERPPKPFNVARIERVFNSMLHFVELRIEDYKLTSRSISLNAKLFGVKNAEVVSRLKNRYHLFAESDALDVKIPAFDESGEPLPKQPKQKFGSRSIDDERKRIKARFIMEAGDFGLVILRKDVADFQQELELLKIKIAAYKEAVQGIIENRTDEIVAELLAALKETLRANPPEHWRSHFLGKEPSDADVQRLFENEIRSEVKRVKTDFDPRVFHAFKDVTYETFHDKGFRKLLENRFGTDAIARLFSEHDAAPEKKETRR